MGGAVRIVGAGQAGLQVALSLREQGFADEITLIGTEPHLPYHRPPLSKRGLTEPLEPNDLAIRNSTFLAQRGIETRLDLAVQAIDRGGKAIRLADGSTMHYQTLVLTTGSVPRRPAVLGADLPNVVGLKDYADLQRLRALLVDVKRAVVIGGGFVGLELASSLTQKGIQVTVLEAAPRVLTRVASPDLSAHIEAAHRARGVDIRTGVLVSALVGGHRVTSVTLASGENIPADLVLVGIGADADDRLAAAAGLDTAQGICVDGLGRTSDPSIYAAGDCVRFDHPLYGAAMRLESVNNALDQARWVAASIAGQPSPMLTIPWFWSDQFDLKIQLAGIPSPLDSIQALPDGAGFIRHHTRDGVLRAVEAVNAPRAFMLARRRIETEMSKLYALQGAA